MQEMNEEEAAATKPHVEKKAFYNSGLSADVKVPVGLASSQAGPVALSQALSQVFRL